MISGKNILNELCNKNETIKNLMMFPVLIGKNKNLEIHTVRRKKEMVCQYPSASVK